jgi:RNA polymerase sigma factor for flagellar operon FliA
MISMEGVPSSLILRNESWVRKEAQAMARRLPANVEKADLIQAGLIAVAQAALGFVWEGDRESPEAKEAFVRYARRRVHGAMLDELRAMDHLSRDQRRQVKMLQVTRERWRSSHGSEATAAQIGEICGLGIDEIFELDKIALQAQQVSSTVDAADEDHPLPHEAATAQDEVEARVDTGLLMRRLESFFATLPERDRQVIDAYLGVGLSPAQLALELNVSAMRVSQIFKSVCDRIGEVPPISRTLFHPRRSPRCRSPSRRIRRRFVNRWSSSSARVAVFATWPKSSVATTAASALG